MTTNSTVYVVDGDAVARNALQSLSESVGLSAASFPTIQDFLHACAGDPPGCLVTELRLTGMSGLELLERRSDLGLYLPVIILTAHGDVRTSVRAMKAGAFDFLEKPVHEQELLERIHHALEFDGEDRHRRAQRDAVAERLDRLTAREHEILNLLVAGTTNKTICARLGISRKTLDAHRSNLLKKLEAGSLAELFRVAFLTGWDTVVS
jgi:FixJ family two-component response regulator